MANKEVEPQRRRFTRHATYTGPDCAMCGQPENLHEQPEQFCPESGEAAAPPARRKENKPYFCGHPDCPCSGGNPHRAENRKLDADSGVEAAAPAKPLAVTLHKEAGDTVAYDCRGDVAYRIKAAPPAPQAAALIVCDTKFCDHLLGPHEQDGNCTNPRSTQAAAEAAPPSAPMTPDEWWESEKHYVAHDHWNDALVSMYAEYWASSLRDTNTALREELAEERSRKIWDSIIMVRDLRAERDALKEQVRRYEKRIWPNGE